MALRFSPARGTASLAISTTIQGPTLDGDAASQVDAETGTSFTKWMSPGRVAQAAAAYLVGTRAVALTKSISSTILALRTTGYATPGDGGAALYKRALVEPTHPGKFQSFDGAWWELSERIVRPEMFGDAATVLTNANLYSAAVNDAFIVTSQGVLSDHIVQNSTSPSAGAILRLPLAGVKNAATPSVRLLLDDEDRLVSPGGIPTATRPTRTAQDPLSEIYSGYPMDAAIAVANQWTKTNTTGVPFIYNQISSIVYATGDTWGIGHWGVGVSIPSGSIMGHAWAFGGLGAAWSHLDSFARGAEFGCIAGNSLSDPPGDYTSCIGVSFHAAGNAAGYHPTAIVGLSSNMIGGAPQHGILISDQVYNTIKPTGSILVTNATAFGTVKTLSCANGINLLNSTFSGYAFVHGTDNTPLSYIDGNGAHGAATGTLGGYWIANAPVLQVASSSTVLKDPDAHGGLYLGPAAAPTNFHDNTTHTFRNRAGLATFTNLTSAKLDQVAGYINAATGTGGGYWIADAPVLQVASSLTQIKDPDAHVGIWLGPAANALNIYDNTQHIFRNRDTLTTFGTLSSTGWVLTVPQSITSTSSAAAVVGRQGATNPAWQIDASTASCVTGLKLTAKAAAASVNLAVTSSGTNEALVIDGKGTGGVAIKGTGTNDTAAAGYVGEYVSSTVVFGSAVSLTSSVAANVTSISLTAGDWIISGVVHNYGGATTTVTSVTASISTTSATHDSAPGRHFNGDFNGALMFDVANITAAVPMDRISLSATTTVYLVSSVVFAVSTAVAFGKLWAIRVR